MICRLLGTRRKMDSWMANILFLFEENSGRGEVCPRGGPLLAHGYSVISWQ